MPVNKNLEVSESPGFCNKKWTSINSCMLSGNHVCDMDKEHKGDHECGHCGEKIANA